MSFNFDMGNVTKHLNDNGNTDLGCMDCSNFGPDSIGGVVADPGLPALKPNVAIIIIGLGFTLILVAAFALFAKFMRPHLSGGSRGQDGSSRMWDDVIKDGHLLDTSVINNLPLVIFSSESFLGMNLDSECAVCLSPFEVREELRLLPNCKHMFHPSCVDNWLRSHPTCPLCRSTIISASWSIQNPPGVGDIGTSEFAAPTSGAVALNIFVSSLQTVEPNGSSSSRRSSISSGGFSHQHALNGDVHALDAAHVVEVTVDQQQVGSPTCVRDTSSCCGGSLIMGPWNSSSVFQQTQRVADVHEFDPHHNAGQSSQSSQSVFIFMPQVPTNVSSSNSNTNTKNQNNNNRFQSAISKLHDEVRSSLEASVSLRKFGNKSSNSSCCSSPIEASSSSHSQSSSGGGCSPSFHQGHSATEACHGICTGERGIIQRL
ncbi:hypothetical protein R1flu_023020 [Riccia fluitans]|uniref:RING-type E3 ubiquitin transferase n=1 Tax=Riccia fluitans TaxID=41844 RepID=A0ABD1XRJ4_9MARC